MEEGKVEWKGEGYAKNSSLQEYYAHNFIYNNPLFPQFVRKDDLTVLIDIGCGDGRHTRHIYEKVGGIVYGIDLTPKQIEHARATHSVTGEKTCLKYFILDATQLDTLKEQYPDEIIDVDGKKVLENWVDRVVSFTCIHWIRDHRTLYQQIFKALKPGGRVDILFPWDSPGISDWMKMISALPQVIKANVKLPKAFWTESESKSELLRELDNIDDPNQIYDFSSKGEGTTRLLKHYKGWLTEIGFEVEELKVMDDTAPYIYNSREDFEGFVAQWFPKVSEDENEQKTVMGEYIDGMIPSIGILDESGKLTGFKLQLDYVYLHMRKPNL